jgi:hypothetical protein
MVKEELFCTQGQNPKREGTWCIGEMARKPESMSFIEDGKNN